MMEMIRIPKYMPHNLRADGAGADGGKVHRRVNLPDSAAHGDNDNPPRCGFEILKKGFSIRETISLPLPP